MAHAGGIATGHAVSLHLFAYYAGPSGLGGLVWELGAWPGVVLLAAGLVGLSGLLALCLEKVPSSDVPRG